MNHPNELEAAAHALRALHSWFTDHGQRRRSVPVKTRTWTRTQVVRAGGITKGKVDTFYFNPAGTRFRSLVTAKKAGFRGLH
jgi:hypothetical protein